MVAAPVTSGWTGNNDGAGVGLSFTTPAGVTATQSLLVFIGSSSNADTITVPATGTWADITLPDNVVTSSGGQFRAFQCLNPASSTAYAFSMGATRRTLVWVLVDGADLTGGTMVAIASSLESAAATTHAPPSVVPPASGLGVFDCLAYRQFNPDASTCSPPAAGLTWTELQDVRGLDVGGSGQNIQMAVNYAVAGASGVAISTSPLNTVDAFEPALVIRVVLKSAAGGGSDVILTDTSSGASTSGGTADAPTVSVVKTDTSGAASSGGTADAPTVGRIYTDTSSGASSSGSTADAPTVGVVKTDTSGGASSGGQADVALVGVVKTDTSGGASSGGQGDAPTVDLIRTDTSGGASSGGTADTAGSAVVLTDTSGGSSSGGTADAATVGVTLTDLSGSASSGGTPDPLTVSVIRTDASGGASSGGQADTAGSSVTITDTSGGATAAGQADVPTRTVVLVDTSGGATAAGSANTVTGGASGTTDTSGGATGGSSPNVLTGAGAAFKRDPMVMPLLQEVLACLQAQASLVEAPPAHYHIRPGAGFEPSADRYGRDECCDGIGWVRMVSNYEGQDDAWIAPNGIPSNCPPIAWAVVVEVGLMRCVPMAGDNRGGNVTSAQWTAAAQAQLDDAAALRRVLCCIREIRGVADVVAGQVSPLESTGGCGGVTITMTIRADACDDC